MRTSDKQWLGGRKQHMPCREWKVQKPRKKKTIWIWNYVWENMHEARVRAGYAEVEADWQT